LFCVVDDRVDETRANITQEMTTPPAWMPDLPLAVEIKEGNNYGNMQ
jgi:hypothetical protein